MNIFEKIFGKTSSVMIAETPTKSVVVLIFDKEQEYRDLQEIHNEFFSEKKSPKLLMQSSIGQTSANIADVLPSRSDVFFMNAPGFTMIKRNPFEKEIDQILLLKNYMGVPTEEEEFNDFVMIDEESADALISLQSRLSS